MKRRDRYTGYECNLHSIPDFKMKYPEYHAYNPGRSPVHTSPCMDPYWRSQPIRQGKARGEYDFEMKQVEDE